MKKRLLSVVIPAYNESEGIEEFHSKHLSPALEAMSSYNFNIWYVKDGSRTTKDPAWYIATPVFSHR